MAVLGRVGPGSAGASGCAVRAPQRLSNRHVAPGGGRTAAHPWARAHVLKTYRTGGAGTTLATAGRLIPPALGTGALSGRNKRPQAARGLSATCAPFSLAAPLLMLARHCGAPALTGDCRARISEPHAGPSPRVARGLPGAEKQGQARRSRLLASALAGPGPRLPSPASVFFLSEEEELGGFLLGRSVCRKTSPFAPPP